MSLTTEKTLKTAAGDSAPHRDLNTDERLQIAVVFTSVRATLIALREAASLADKLNARITLIVPQVVPFPAPLETPVVLRDFNEHRLRLLAADSRVDMDVLICLCRDRFEELHSRLASGSIVVLAGSQTPWPARFWQGKFRQSSEARLARRLQSAGYEVIFRETE